MIVKDGKILTLAGKVLSADDAQSGTMLTKDGKLLTIGGKAVKKGYQT